MRSLNISLYGTSVLVKSELASEVCPLRDLEWDFSRFNSQLDGPCPSIELYARETLAQVRILFRLGRLPWRGKKVSWAYTVPGGFCRWIECSWECHVLMYGGFSKTPRIKVFTSNARLAYQMAFQYALALLGEGLERLDFVRLHAVAWRRHRRGEVTLCLGDSGAGKSTLAANLEETDCGEVISDEICLWKGGELFPFPLPIAKSADSSNPILLRKRSWQIGKDLIPLSISDLQSSAVERFVVLKKSNRVPLMPLREVNPLDKVTVICKIVFGLGLPQMAEVYVRGSNLRFGCFVAIRRMKAAWALLSGKSQIFLYSTSDPFRIKNLLERLENFAETQGGEVAKVSRNLPAGTLIPRAPSRPELAQDEGSGP